VAKTPGFHHVLEIFLTRFACVVQFGSKTVARTRRLNFLCLTRQPGTF
jgi:hypothetical protein